MMTVGQLMQALAGVDPRTTVVVSTHHDNDQALAEDFRAGLIDVVPRDTTPSGTIYREIDDLLELDDEDDAPMLAFALIANNH